MPILKTFGDETLGSDKYNLIVQISCIFLIILQVGTILFAWGKLPPQVPIFYSRPWGEQYLSHPFALLILPAISVIFLVVNNLVSMILTSGGLFLSRILRISNLMICLATTYSVFKIITLLL